MKRFVKSTKNRGGRDRNTGEKETCEKGEKWKKIDEKESLERREEKPDFFALSFH